MNTSIMPKGDIIDIKTTDQRHFGVSPSINKPGDFMAEFTNAIQNAVENVNNLQITADKKSTQMITKPNSIDAHEVMIAAEEAQLSLNLTKNILTKTIDAYKNITSLR